MTNLEFFQWISLLLGIAIILAMVYTRNIDVTGLVVLLVGIYYFSNKFGVNSIFVKVAMGIITFIIVISVFSFLFSTENKLPEFGKNLLISDVHLFSNPAPILANKIASPDSPKYTYAFSFYLKTAATNAATNAAKTYIFCRNDDNVHSKNIGLRFGNTANDFRTLYLDYTIKPANSFTTLVYSNFPIGQWTDIVISVDATIINVYIDGKNLTKQIYAPNLKAPSATTPIEFGNMDAYLANFYHSPDTIKPTQSLIDYLSKVDGIGV